MRRVTARSIFLILASLFVTACVAESLPVPSSQQVAPATLASGSAAPSPSTRSVEPSANESLTPAPPSGRAPDIPLDLSGTTWLLTDIDGNPPGREPPPRIEFDLIGRPFASGYTGCEAFGFWAQIEGSSFTADRMTTFECQGDAAALERAFLAALGGTESWSAEGDVLTLDGTGGSLRFARDLPSRPDRARFVADTLRGAGWRLLGATGVPNRDALPLATFGDTSFVAAGECGYSGTVHFEDGGVIRIEEVGWDTSGCHDPDQPDGRPKLQRLLEAVTTGRVRQDGRVMLSGPPGQVVYGR